MCKVHAHQVETSRLHCFVPTLYTCVSSRGMSPINNNIRYLLLDCSLAERRLFQGLSITLGKQPRLGMITLSYYGTVNRSNVH